MDSGLKVKPNIKLNLKSMSHGKSINPVRGMLRCLRGMPLWERHQPWVMMGPMISKVPLKVSVGVRLHASILNLMLSDYDIVYSGRMCAM